MSTKEDRSQLFVKIFDSLKISQGRLAVWMYHEDTKTTRRYVSRKYTNKTSVTKSDISLLESLSLLALQGFDLKSVQFSDGGKLIYISKHK